MRDSGKVFSRIWESSDFRSMSEDGRTLVMYLLTCQHGTIAGVFRVPDGYACEDLQWPSERVASAFAETLDKGFANRCGTSKWVWVTKYLEWNPPENPNQVKAAKKMALSIPEGCAWKSEFMRVCGPSLGLEEPAKQPHSETLGEGLENPSLTSNSSSSSNSTSSVAKATGETPDDPDPIFGDGLAFLVGKGVPEKGARSFLGKMRQTVHDDLLVVELLVKARQEDVSEPLPWLRAAASRRMSASRLGGSQGVAL